MSITSKNVLKHELIGLEIEVLESPNKNEVGKKGIVVDETKNTIVISTRDGEKKVQKKQRKFMIILPDKKKLRITGDKLSARPEERTKKKVKRWY